jgi:hypothetical protein
MEANSSTLVFISHSSKDKDFVRTLAKDLRANAIDIWLDEEQIMVGESITERVADGLSRCTHLIIILSENFQSSRWCTTELRAILHREIKEHKNRILGPSKLASDL